MLTLTHEGRTFANFEIAELKAADVPDAAIADAARNAASAKMLLAVDGYRQRLAGAEAGTVKPGPERIGIWAAKARVSREHVAAPSKIPDVEPGFFKSRLTREATAKGRTLKQQLERIVFKADTFEGLGMMIDAMEAEAMAGLSGVSDEAGLAGGFDAFLAQAAEEADTAFAEALAALAA